MGCTLFGGLQPGRVLLERAWQELAEYGEDGVVVRDFAKDLQSKLLAKGSPEACRTRVAAGDMGDKLAP
jgi:hypothetical protein